MELGLAGHFQPVEPELRRHMSLESNVHANPKDNYHRTRIGIPSDQIGMASDQIGIASDQIGIASDQIGIASDQLGIARTNNLVKSENLTITCDYPIPNVFNTSSERFKTEKSNISVKDVLQQDSCSSAIKAEPTYDHFPEGQLKMTKNSEPRENNTSQNHGNQSHQLKQMMDSAPARTAATVKRFACDICGKTFSRSCYVNKHKRCHTGEKPFICDFCDRGFSLVGNLKRHIRSHTGEKPFICSVCEKGFSQATFLVEHKRTHTGEKPFICNFCDKRFAQGGTLRKHKRIHTGDKPRDKPFVCNVCNKEFSQACNLAAHKRSHTGEKPFVCELCDQRFGHQTNFKNHKRIHTGEKPFVCNFCDLRFSRSSTLVRHKRSLHAEETPLSVAGVISGSQKPVVVKNTNDATLEKNLSSVT